MSSVESVIMIAMVGPSLSARLRRSVWFNESSLSGYFGLRDVEPVAF